MTTTTTALGLGKLLPKANLKPADKPAGKPVDQAREEAIKKVGIKAIDIDIYLPKPLGGPIGKPKDLKFGEPTPKGKEPIKQAEKGKEEQKPESLLSKPSRAGCDIAEGGAGLTFEKAKKMLQSK